MRRSIVALVGSLMVCTTACSDKAPASSAADGGGGTGTGDAGGTGGVGGTQACSAECDDCQSGRCLTVIHEGRPGSLAVDGANVYWIEVGTGADDYDRAAVMKSPVGQNSPEVLVADLPNSGSLIIRDANLYWGTCNVWGTRDDVVMTVPVGGGAPVTIAPGQRCSGYLALDGGDLYWANSNELMSIPLVGGTPRAMLTGIDFFAGLLADAGELFFVNQGTSGKPGSVTSLMKMATGSETPTALWSTPGVGLAANTALDAHNVYWSFGDSVMKIDRTGGTPVVLASGQTAPANLVVDGDSVYWINAGTQANAWNDGAILKTAIAGGTPTTLATDQRGPFALAVDGTNVYWSTMPTGSDAFDGKLMAAPKD